MKISEIIIGWYKKNARDLPWRNTDDPFLIWMSEIILQQTRVNQGLSYYIKFAARFSDVRSLAEADEQEVMRLWQGLGYYSRARNMLFAARQVMDEYEGKFPADHKTLLQLKGIGPYTAAAIASIAYNEAVAVVDGNVSRVLSRLFAVKEPVNSTLGIRTIQEMADEILDTKDPGTHNQALMEFGALQCLPVNPDCDACPAKLQCMAYAENIVKELPVKLKTVKVKSRYFYYVLIEDGGHIYFRKRTGDDIWKSLFEFPMFESAKEMSDGELLRELISLPELEGLDGVAYSIHKISDQIKHVLTHRNIFARFVHVEVQKGVLDVPGDWVKVPIQDIDNYPLPRLIDRYISIQK